MADTGVQKKGTDGPSNLTWHTGTLLPYASLWSTVHRLVYLNALTANEIHLLGTRQHGYLGMNSLIANYRVIDLPTLAKSLGEPLSAFNLSTLESLSLWTHQLFQVNVLRFCPECLAQGFHSIFHCLLAIFRCPIHHVTLEERCKCRRPVSACLNPQLFSSPCQCQCAKCHLFSRYIARRPTLDPLSAHAFDEIASWIQTSSKRIHMMCVAEPWKTATGEGELTQLLPIWSSLANVDVPLELSSERPRPNSVVEFFDGSPLTSDAGPDLSTGRDAPQASTFSAIDRHLRRHILRGQRWIHRFSMSCDVDYILDCINRYPEARVAWTYMLWLMGVFGVTELRALRSSAAHSAYKRGMSLQGTQAYVGTTPLALQQFQWLERHSAATFLMSIWKEAFQIGIAAISRQYVEWGHGLLRPNGLFRWLATQIGNDRIRFAAVSRAGPNLASGGNLGAGGSGSRQSQIGKGSRAFKALPNLGLIKCNRIDWSSGELSRPPPNEAPHLKLHQLFGVDGDLHFVVFHRDSATGQVSVARLIEFAIEAHGNNFREAIGTLRTAVSQYRRTILPNLTTEFSERFPTNTSDADADHMGSAGPSGPRQDDRGLKVIAIMGLEKIKGMSGRWKRSGSNMYRANDDFDAIQAWIQGVADGKKPSTLEAYVRAIEKFVFWSSKVKGMVPSDLTTDDLREFSEFLSSPPQTWVRKAAHLRESPDWRPFRKNLDAVSIKATISIVKTMYREWHEAAYLVRDPMSAYSNSEKSKEYFWLTRSDWIHIYKALLQLESTPQARRLRASVVVLRECSVSLKEAVLLEFRHLRHFNDQWVLLVEGGSKSARNTRLSPDAVNFLVEHLRDRQERINGGGVGRYAELSDLSMPLIGSLIYCAARDLDAPIPVVASDLATGVNSTGRIGVPTLRKIVHRFMEDLANRPDSTLDRNFMRRVDHWIFDPSRQSESRRKNILVQKILGNYSNIWVDTPEVEAVEKIRIQRQEYQYWGPHMFR